MITEKTMYKVKNRSSSVAVYKIPETGVRREFAPGEVKNISFGELEKLVYQPGGRELLENFLQIMEEEVTNGLNVKREPEYNMSEAQVAELLVRGSLDAFLDALDFAPIGVIDLIKSLAISIPLQDLNKIKALKDKTGFDVSKALIHIDEEKAAEREENSKGENKSAVRRVQPAPAEGGRRTSGEAYTAEEKPAVKIIKKVEEAE